MESTFGPHYGWWLLGDCVEKICKMILVLGEKGCCAVVKWPYLSPVRTGYLEALESQSAILTFYTWINKDNIGFTLSLSVNLGPHVSLV